MIKISKLADYAMQILQVILLENRTLSASECAKLTLIPISTAAKVLKLLTDAQILQSVQGPKGGYTLQISGDTLTVANIVAAIDGAPALTTCSQADFHCAQVSVCTQQRNWQTINRLIYDVLNQITLLEMTRQLSTKKLLTLKQSTVKQYK
jgi:FeS assembly SUF system regulator